LWKADEAPRIAGKNTHRECRPIQRRRTACPAAFRVRGNRNSSPSSVSTLLTDARSFRRSVRRRINQSSAASDTAINQPARSRDLSWPALVCEVLPPGESHERRNADAALRCANGSAPAWPPINELVTRQTMRLAGAGNTAPWSACESRSAISPGQTLSSPPILAAGKRLSPRKNRSPGPLRPTTEY